MNNAASNKHGCCALQPETFEFRREAPGTIPSAPLLRSRSASGKSKGPGKLHSYCAQFARAEQLPQAFLESRDFQLFKRAMVRKPVMQFAVNWSEEFTSTVLMHSLTIFGFSHRSHKF